MASLLEILAERARRERERRSGQAPQQDVVAETQDGGRVIRAQDGSLSFTSPGYSTSDPAQIERLMQGATIKQEVQRGRDQQVLDEGGTTLPTIAKVAQGTPFVGQWLDEGLAQVNPDAAARMREGTGAMDRQMPGRAIGAEIVGGVLGSVPLAMSAASGYVERAAGSAGRIGRGFLAGMTAGAAEGAVSEAGRANDGNRGDAALFGGVVGAGVGGVVGALMPLVGGAARDVSTRIKRLDVRTIANEFGISMPAARVVKNSLLNDDLDAAAARLARGGDDMMLGEAGPSTRNLMDTAMQTGGAALREGRDAVAARSQAAGSQFKRTLDDVLGQPDGLKAATRKISQRTAAARQAAYDRAYNQPTPTVGPAADALDAALKRIDPDTMRAALREANAEMRDTGYVNRNIIATINPDGTVTFSQPLSVLQLDYIARGLGNVADKGTDALTGKVSPEARRAISQARALRDALKDGVSGYQAALKMGGDAIREREALLTGRRLLNSATTVEDVRTITRNASDAEKAAARQGLRQNIDAIMGRARATIADLEEGRVDFETGENAMREAVAAMRGLLTRDNMLKSRLVLGTADAKQLMDQVEKMADVMVLRSAVARNSATAIRRATQEGIAAETAPGLARRTAGNIGSPLDATREVTRELAAIDPRSISQEQAQYLEEISTALTQIKGPEAQRALTVIRQAMAGQPIKDDEALFIGRLVGSSAAGGMYQAGNQMSMPR